MTIRDTEIRILQAIRSVGSRDHLMEQRKRDLRETALMLMLVAVVAIIFHWSMK